MTKQEISKSMIMKRKEFTVIQREPWDKIIRENVFDRILPNTKVGIYASFNSEVDTYAIMETLFWDDSIEIYAPRVSGKDLDFVRVRSFQDFEPGTMGILEPVGTEHLDPEACDVMIIPIVSFNHKGYRVGYGGGYYDRYLAKSSAFRIGIAYEFQLTEEPFVEAHDIPCDMVITERTIYARKEEINS